MTLKAAPLSVLHASLLTIGAVFGTLASAQLVHGATADSRDVEKVVRELLADRTPVEALEVATAVRDSVWRQMPLGFTVATFVAEPSDEYGSFTPRPNAIFESSDRLSVYLEPVGFGHTPTGFGSLIDLSINVAITTQSGQVIVSQDDFLSVERTTGTPSYEFSASVSLTIAEFSPGSYNLELNVSDAASEKAGRIVLPFEILATETADDEVEPAQ